MHKSQYLQENNQVKFEIQTNELLITFFISYSIVVYAFVDTE